MGSYYTWSTTPTGVFMLRQYMLTIPDELLEAARMDAASEWSIYWRIVFPLALPAIAVLVILSIIWRWNDLILPMIAVSSKNCIYYSIMSSRFSGRICSSRALQIGNDSCQSYTNDFSICFSTTIYYYWHC